MDYAFVKPALRCNSSGVRLLLLTVSDNARNVRNAPGIHTKYHRRRAGEVTPCMAAYLVYSNPAPHCSQTAPQKSWNHNTRTLDVPESRSNPSTSQVVLLSRRFFRSRRSTHRSEFFPTLSVGRDLGHPALSLPQLHSVPGDHTKRSRALAFLLQSRQLFSSSARKHSPVCQCSMLAHTHSRSRCQQTHTRTTRCKGKQRLFSFQSPVRNMLPNP